MTDRESHLDKLDNRSKLIKSIISYFVLVIALSVGVYGVVQMWPKDKPIVEDYKFYESVRASEGCDNALTITTTGVATATLIDIDTSADAITFGSCAEGIDITFDDCTSDDIAISDCEND